MIGTDRRPDDLRSTGRKRSTLVDELEHAARVGPVLVCLDDLQRADDGSMLVVHRLLRRLADLPILWLLAFRREESDAAFAALGFPAVRVSLGALDDAATAQIVHDLIGAPAGEALLELAKRMKGSPFLLTELLLGLLDERLFEVRHGRAELVELRLPARLRDDLDGRLQRMTPEARRVAEAGAVLGNRFRVGLLSLVLSAVPVTLLGPIQELIGSGLLVDDGVALAFLHGFVRDAVLDSVPAPTRRLLERKAVDTLLASGASPMAVGQQLADSAVAGDAHAVALLYEAAHGLTATEPDASATLALRALELAGADDPTRGALISAVVSARHAAGRAGEGVAFAEAALADGLPPEQAATVLLSISSVFTLSNDALSTAGRRALALPAQSEVVRAQLLTRLVHNVVVSGRLAEAQALAAEARTLVRTVADPDARFALATAEVALQYGHGRFRQALSQADAALAGVQRGTDDARVRWLEQWRAEILLVLDRVDEAARLGDEQLAANRRDRQQFAVQLWEDWRGRLFLSTGRLDEAATALGSLARDSEPRPILTGADGGALVAFWRVARHTGRTAAANHAARLADAVVDDGTPDVRRHAAWLLAQHAAAAGDAGAASSALAGLADELPLAVFPTDPTAWPQLVRVALTAGAHDLARRAVAVAVARAEHHDSATAAASHARGLLTGDLVELELAVAGFAPGPWRLAHASALEDLGRAHRARDERDSAIARWNEALGHYAGSGATWDATRVRGRLRALGVRRRLPVSTRPAAGWDALTTAELSVIRTVAAGLTNREVAQQMFVSPHTVKAHLSNVYAKLGIGSRAELARLVLEHGDDPVPA